MYVTRLTPHLIDLVDLGFGIATVDFLKAGIIEYIFTPFIGNALKIFYLRMLVE
jgi:hypothetical protein